MADNSGAVDLSSLGNKDNPMKENTSPEVHLVRTAFVVIIESDGTVNVTPDLDAPILRDQAPNSDEIYGALKTAAKDIEVQETALNSAQATANFMQQIAAQQMAAMRNQQLAQSLNLGGN